VGTVAEDPGSGNEKSGEALWREVLEGLKLNGTHNAIAFCPVHDDRPEPSLTITVRQKGGEGSLTALFHCKGCGANGNAVAAALDVPRYRLFYGGFPSFGHRRPWTVPLPSVEQIADWRVAFAGDVADALVDWRGIPANVFRRYHVGWDGERYCLPVYRDRRLVNVCRCTLRYEGQPQKGLRVWPGPTSRYLYPNVLQGSWVLLCEGPWDALMGRAHRLPTLTTIGGAQVWPEAELARACAGRNVAICLDPDRAGRLGTAKVITAIRPVAEAIKVVRLPCDLSDFLSRNSKSALLERVVGQTTLGKRKASGRGRSV
jgi:hypothetical protein